MRRKVVLRDSAESTLSFYVFVYACTWGGKDFPEVSKRKDDNALTDERIKELEPTSGRERRIAVCPTNTAAGFRKAAGAVGTMIIGFFFGGTEFPLGAYPLGSALVAAVPKYSVFALIGVLLRCAYAYAAGEDLLLFGLSAAALCACRILLCVAVYGRKMIRKTGRLPDSVSARVLLCAIFTLGFSLIGAIQAGSELYDIASLALNTVCAASFAFLLSFFFEPEYRFTPAFEAGLGAAAFCLSLSLVNLYIGTFSIGLVVSYMITLYVGWLGQPTRSSAVGLLCGLACGGIYAPIFALSGLIAGIFFEVNSLLAAAGSIAVMICGALYFSGTEAISAFLPEIITAAVLIAVPAMLRILPSFSMKAVPAEASDCRELIARRREEERERRMESIAGSMNALSSIMHSLSEKFRRPRPEKLSEKCMQIWRRHCEMCPNECTCRGLEEMESDKASDKLASRLMASGKIDREKLYEITKVKCPMLDAIAKEISVCSAKMLEEAIREDKTQIFAFDYEAMAQMFADAASEGTIQFNVDKVLSDRLRRRFLRSGLRAENLVVCGDRKKYVIATGPDIARTELRPAAIREICEAICGVKFSMPEFMLENGRSALTLESTPCYTVEYSGKQVSKKGENVCGDSVSVVKSYDDYFYCFICDGMGSGEDAALTSRMCRVFLEKMLACGNKKSTTLEMLNNLVCSKSTECFATVDLLEVDLMQGIASFIKSGAVPSYVIREKHLYKIASGTFPIGIVPQVSAEVTEFELEDGDVILLCSDGVASDIEACETGDPAWFVEFISTEWTDNLGVMAEKIIHAAQGAAARADDMTVELVRVRKISETSEDAA